MRSELRQCRSTGGTECNARFACVARAVLQEACLLDKDWGKLDILKCASCGYNTQYRVDV